MDKIKKTMTDLELVFAIKEGSELESRRAYNALFKKYNSSMLYHFKKLVKNNEDDAKELVLEAFEKMSLNIEKFNQETAVFSTWFFKLTQNIFIDRLRKKKEEVSCISDLAVYDNENNATEFEVEGKEFTPEEELLRSEKNKKILEVINTIENKELVDVIMMRYFDGMSYDEISKATEKPLGTVKAFLFRAKGILKEKFIENKIQF